MVRLKGAGESMVGRGEVGDFEDGVRGAEVVRILLWFCSIVERLTFGREK